MKLLASAFALTAWMLCCAALASPADSHVAIRKLAQKEVPALPSGALYWRVEQFDSLGEAQAAAGEYGLAAQSADGRAWLFTLGAKGSEGRGKAIAEIGPIEAVSAPRYLLRINEASGAPGAKTSVHMHPGSEAFFVLAGEQTIRNPHHVLKLHAGDATPGSGPNVPMQVVSTGTDGMHALVMFIIDATQPFSSPAHLP